MLLTRRACGQPAQLGSGARQLLCRCTRPRSGHGEFVTIDTIVIKAVQMQARCCTRRCPSHTLQAPPACAMPAA